jgi:transcriptional regulator with XRE-family HTH domain
MMNIGDRIRKLRRERNWTQDELGKRVGIVGHNVARYESGRTAPRKPMLERFAQAFETTVDELISESRPPEAFQADPEFLQIFREIVTLEEPDLTALKRILKLLVKQNRIQHVIAS